MEALLDVEQAWTSIFFVSVRANPSLTLTDPIARSTFAVRVHTSQTKAYYIPSRVKYNEMTHSIIFTLVILPPVTSAPDRPKGCTTAAAGSF